MCPRTQLRDLAATTPEFCLRHLCPPKIRGRGECRALDAPVALCAVKVKAHKHSHHGHTGNTRHSPRNGFNGFLRALPGDRACLPPSPLRSVSFSANLTPASGRQDHTASPSAGESASRLAPPASTASRPASVTIASRPSLGRDQTAINLLLPCRQAKFGKSEIAIMQLLREGGLLTGAQHFQHVVEPGQRQVRMLGQHTFAMEVKFFGDDANTPAPCRRHTAGRRSSSSATSDIASRSMPTSRDKERTTLSSQTARPSAFILKTCAMRKPANACAKSGSIQYRWTRRKLPRR